jgi:hypothetical protein
VELCWREVNWALGSAPVPLVAVVVPALWEYAVVSVTVTVLALVGHALRTRHGPAVVSAVTIALLLASLGKNYLICGSGVARIDDEWRRFIPLMFIVVVGPIAGGALVVQPITLVGPQFREKNPEVDGVDPSIDDSAYPDADWVSGNGPPFIQDIDTGACLKQRLQRRDRGR